MSHIFTDSMYHNQSEDVYIEALEPNRIKITKSGTTWNQFFETLPFTLTKECLVTGTKQTFCTSDSGTLSFYLNDQEMPDVLDAIVAADDHLRVEFK